MATGEKRLSLAQIHYPNQKNNETEQIPVKRWIRFLYEPMININTFKECIALGNFNGDGENKLVVVDSSNDQYRLKLLRGLTLITDTFLPGQPSGIVSFISEGGSIPCIAVAIGSSLLIYRNLKPYYRYNVESMDLDLNEVNLWNLARDKKIDHDELYHELESIKSTNATSRLSFLTQYYLTIKTSDERLLILTNILSNSTKINLTNVLISCLTTIKKNLVDESTPDVLVIGTESGSLYWIDTTAFNVLGHCRISMTPDKILTLGEFELESRYIISTREGDVIVLKKNQEHKFNQSILNIKDHVLALASSRNNVIIATKTFKLLFFTLKMKKLSEIQFDEQIFDLETFNYEPKLYSGVLVAFKNHINLYIDGILMDILKTDPIEWIKYGRFGREDAVLIIGHEVEGITVMNFRRTAILTEIVKPKAPPSTKIQIPKTSRMYIDKALRERENPHKIHIVCFILDFLMKGVIFQTSQRDLFMLKLNITRSFAELTTSQSGLLPTKDTEQLNISSEIHGFGPQFRITITIIAAGDLPDEKRWIGFSYDKHEYSMEYQLIPMTKITHKIPSIYSNPVICLHPEKGLQSQVKIVIMSESKKQPLWMTKFEMPVSEQSMV